MCIFANMCTSEKYCSVDNSRVFYSLALQSLSPVASDNMNNTLDLDYYTQLCMLYSKLIQLSSSRQDVCVQLHIHCHTVITRSRL